MFVREIVSKPAYVEGRKFVDRTIESKFKKADVSITTTYMNGKPLVKQYIFKGEGFLKHYWKNLKDRMTTETTLKRRLNKVV